MLPDEPGFLIGAPLAILFHRLEQQVFDGLAAAGFADLSPSYLPVFQVLGPEGSRISDMARKAGTTKQAMGYLVAYLERRGYVERMPDKNDRRAALVARTDRGWEVNRMSRELVEHVQSEWTQLIGEKEMTVLLRVLRQLVVGLGVEYRGSVADINVLAARGLPHRRPPGARSAT